MARKKATAEQKIEDKSDLIETKRKIILSHWSGHHEKEPVKLSELPLEVVVTVIALMSSSTDSERDSISNVSSHVESFFPNADESYEFLKKAFREEAIIVDVGKSRVEDFTDDGESFYLSKVNYLPNITWNDSIPLETVRSPIKALDHLHQLFMQGCWYEDWTDQLLYLWEKIALAECIEYANNRADTYNFHRDAINLDEICKGLLKTLSVSKIHALISTAFHNAAAFQKTAECNSPRHALNTIPSKIASLASRLPSELKEWDRINQLPRSEVSMTLFTKMLGFERDVGFYDCPSKNYSLIAQKRLETFVDTRSELDKTKISLKELAQSIADNLWMLNYRTDQGLDETTSVDIRASVNTLIEIWTGLSEVDLKDVPEIVEPLALLSKSFDAQGFDFSAQKSILI